ncbi:MAG: hydroxyethylthiazole kinase [Tatlockia sp.]
MFDTLEGLIAQIKKDRPVILNLTNTVTMDFIANGLLALGASPIMTQSQAELACLLEIADALVINLGTLNADFIALCEKACLIANQMGKPIVFDPVGAGASKLRTDTALHFLARFQFAAIRANASEIMALSCAKTNAKGVDSTANTDDALSAGSALSQQVNTLIAMSGKKDVLFQGLKQETIDRGSALMPLVTGSGCLLTAVTAAFLTVDKDALCAASIAHLFYSVCGELAAAHATGPGTFKVHFIDALATTPKRGDYELN